MPILPISVAGTDRIQPPDTLQLWPGKAAVRIHEPIEVEGLGEEDLDELMTKSRERIIEGKMELGEELGSTSKERTFEEEDLSS
jgi:1-acyl-sn-glycerol-3-phosphate acyltransferase